jgi:hypothetical protein
LGSGVFSSVIGVFRIGGVRVDDSLEIVVGIVGKIEVFLQGPLGIFGLFMNPVSFHVVLVLNPVIEAVFDLCQFVGKVVGKVDPVSYR